MTSPDALTGAQKLDLVEEVLNTWRANAEDDDGDRHLASPVYAIEAIDEIMAGNPSRARRDGFVGAQ